VDYHYPLIKCAGVIAKLGNAPQILSLDRQISHSRPVRDEFIFCFGSDKTPLSLKNTNTVPTRTRNNGSPLSLLSTARMQIHPRPTVATDLIAGPLFHIRLTLCLRSPLVSTQNRSREWNGNGNGHRSHLPLALNSSMSSLNRALHQQDPYPRRRYVQVVAMLPDPTLVPPIPHSLPERINLHPIRIFFAFKTDWAFLLIPCVALTTIIGPSSLLCPKCDRWRYYYTHCLLFLGHAHIAGDGKLRSASHPMLVSYTTSILRLIGDIRRYDRWWMELRNPPTIGEWLSALLYRPRCC
jgi:hypothetical protein